MSMRSMFYSLVFVFAFPALLATKANGQQTVFNVPTTDILDPGKVYAELDVSFKPNNGEAQRKFSSFVPRIVVGAGHDVEVGFNLIGHLHPGPDSTTLVTAIKWRFYRHERQKIDLIAGANFYIPVRNRTHNFGTYSYIAGSKTIRKTRLTAGGYIASKNVFAEHATRGGGQLAIEQTINSKVTLAADWFTGRHSSGFFTPGVIYKPHPRVTTYWSYSISNANAAQGHHFFLFEVGYNFN